jgi:hypothetical protein
MANGLALSAAGSALANVPQDIAGLQLAQAKASIGQSQAAEEQNKVQGGLDMSKSLAGNMAGQPQSNDSLANYDNQISAYQKSAQDMAAAGRGDQANAAMQQAQTLRGQKMDHALSLMGQASRVNDYDKALEVGHRAGILSPDIAKVEYDPTRNAVVGKDKDGNIIQGMNKDALDHMGFTPKELADMETKKFSASLMAGSRVTASENSANARVTASENTANKPQLEEVAKIRLSEKRGDISHEDAENRIKAINAPKASGSGSVVSDLPSVGSPQKFESDPARPWRDHPEFRAAMKTHPEYMGLLDQYMNGDLPPGGSRSVKIDKIIQALGARIDPNVSFRDYKLKQDAMKDAQVTASNAALGHIGDFQKTLGPLDNATRSDIVNHSLNWLKSHAQGNETLAELYTTALSLSEEYGKALGAGQNVTGDLKREAVFNPDAPLSVIIAKLHAVGNLMDKTVAAKENILNRSNPKRVPLNLMDPASLEVLQSLGIKHTPGNRGGGGGGTEAPQPPAAKAPAIPLADYLTKHGV